MDSYTSAKEELKRVADIAELIGQYVQLKRAGHNFVGLCPFHSEKDPSFNVNPAKQIFHCFGCKKGGDIFAFWMEYHKVSFPQAMKDLAEKYHVDLPERRMTPAEKEKIDLKEVIYKINEAASNYFHAVLTRSNKGEPGKKYLLGRGLSKDIIVSQRLGYAPDEWNGLTDYLKKQNFDLQKAEKAGLIIPRKNGGFYDRFRGRVIFPIINLRQQFVGFGGRVLDDSLPKYLNSPETPVFRKGELLYGFNDSHKAIREKNQAVIVEGYTDVLSLKAKGFELAVATLGTALTKDHIRILKGYVREAVVVFDSDSAGKAAAVKSLPFFLEEGLASRVLILPEGEDPDSYVKEKGVDGFQGLLDRSVPMFDFFIKMKQSGNKEQIENQIQALKEIIPVLATLNNEAQRSLYIKRLSERTGISEPAVLAELEKWKKTRSQKSVGVELRRRITTSKAKKGDDLNLLNLLTHYPESIGKLVNHDIGRLISDPLSMEIFNLMVKVYNDGKKIRTEEIVENLENEPARERFREIIMMPPFYQENEVDQAVNEFCDKIQKMIIADSKKQALEKGDLEALNKILRIKKDKWG